MFAVGSKFGVYGGTAIGTVLSVGSDRDKTVTYSYAHNEKVIHSLPAKDLAKFTFEK